jgi:hypothetical protein
MKEARMRVKAMQFDGRDLVAEAERLILYRAASFQLVFSLFQAEVS